MTDPIRHVVLLMLENHSFDQMLGCLKGVDGIADPPRSNADAEGRAYPQKPTESRQVTPDPNHETAHVLAQLANGNGGFIEDYLAAHGESARSGCDEVMGYFPDGALPALHPLAKEFTICDRWFSSLPGPTWPNRFFALTGTSNGRVKMPEAGENLHMLWTQTQTTIFDRLNEKKLPWRVYFYDFPASLVLRGQRRPENLMHYHRIDRFFVEARGDEAKFPAFTFIEPKYFGVDQNDDHPPHNVMKAQKLVADVYNAIRSNPKLWESTLLVVAYDEHGGFYDHVEPPAAVPPDDAKDEYTFDRLGVRVPALLISPWLEARVESTTFDHTSLLKYLQEKWDLGPLGQRTAAANSVACAFRSLAAPRADTIPFVRVPHAALIAERPDLEARDESDHHRALHLMADVLAFSDDALQNAVAEAARLARVVEDALPRSRAALGDKLIAWGRALRRPLEDAQNARREKTTRAALAITSSR